MKEFDLEKAKAGHPVCTRDGRPVRILCFDRRREDKSRPIIALVEEEPGNEVVRVYKQNGLFLDVLIDENDLLLAGVKKEGWVNIFSGGVLGTMASTIIFSSKEEAFECADKGRRAGYITTTKIEWEED